MAVQRHILCIVGTRPEGIKMAPLIKALKREPWARVTVLATAQHRDLLDQVLSLFDIQPDVDLDIMRANQQLPELTARLITALDEKFAQLAPDVVLAHWREAAGVVVAPGPAFGCLPDRFRLGFGRADLPGALEALAAIS